MIDQNLKFYDTSLNTLISINNNFDTIGKQFLKFVYTLKYTGTKSEKVQKSIRSLFSELRGNNEYKSILTNMCFYFFT